MDFTKILSISGYGGLFILIAQTKNGVIVESLNDKKRFPVYGAKKISVLEDIAIYTDEDMLALRDVMKRIYDKEAGNSVNINIDKESEKLKAYFEGIVPEYDRNKVYVSDMKKVVKWYNQLHEHKLLNFDEATETEEIKEEETIIEAKEEEKVAVEEETKTKKTTKKTTKKEEVDTEEKKEKKTTAKKVAKPQLALEMDIEEVEVEPKPKRKTKKKTEE